MAAMARCTHRHEWQVDDELLSASHPTDLVCPECGEFGMLHSADSEQETQITEDSNANAPSSPTISPSSVPSPNDPGGHWEELGYEILGTLGRGGMGMVFHARQVRLNRMVALKMVHAHICPGDSAHARFQAEARAVASIQHPNIVQIYEVGEYNEYPFITLELVEGGSLSARLKRSSFSPRQAAQMVATLADAMHVAHLQGIVHRDLKPGNILLTSDDVPKITDFGLVKRIVTDTSTGEPSLTATGEVLGTPSYMAPEQANYARAKITPVTDVYALGAILYELLTHRPPFEGKTPMETVMQVLQQDPIPPTQLQPKLSCDLQTICLTCLQKDPASRYAGADELAADLRSFLAGEPIKARNPNTMDKVAVWAKRHPLGAILIALGAVAGLGFLIGVGFLGNALAVSSLAVFCTCGFFLWHITSLRKTLKQSEEERLAAERSMERLHLLLETTQQLLATDNPEDMLRFLSETTTRMVNAERATVFLIDEDKEELWSKVAMGEDVGEIRLELGEGIAGRVAKSGETINLANPYDDPRFSPETDQRTGYRTRNLLSFAMRGSSNQILGVFQVLNKRAGPFTTEDVELLQ